MSLLFARAAVVPFWMIVVALIVVLGPPGGPGLRDLLLLLGLTLVASAFLALVASAVRELLPPRELVMHPSSTSSLQSTSNRVPSLPR
jgi:hypothetical protein